MIDRDLATKHSHDKHARRWLRGVGDLSEPE